MNLRDLQYILSVADLQHFGKAAEACNVSQPTLSGQILKLEEELGVRIFERVGRKIRVTQVGEQILGHARTAVAAAGDITQLARASRDPLAGSLRIGDIPTVAPYLMPFVLPLAAEALPAAPLMLYEDLTANLVRALAEGRLEAAIIASDPDPGSLLLLADGHCLRDQALSFCGLQGRGQKVGADIRAASLQTLLHLTAARYGITLVPRLAVDNDLGMVGKLAARPLAGPHHSRRIRLAFRTGTPRRQALALLAVLIRNGLPEGVEPLA